MNDDTIMEVEMVNDSTSEEDDEPPPLKVAAIPISPSKTPIESCSATTVGTPVKAAGPSTGATISPDLRPTAAKSIVVRPPAGSGVNGMLGPRATLGPGSPTNFRLAGRHPISQTIKNLPSVKWTQAVPRTQGSPAQRPVFMSTAGQQNQMVTSSGSGSSSLSVFLGAGRQLNKTIVVSPSATGLTKAVNLVPGPYFTTGSDGHTKLVGSSIVQQKEGRVINSPTIRPVNVLTQSGKLIASTQGTRCVTVQGNPRFRVIPTPGGVGRRVLLNPTTQMIRPQSGISEAQNQPQVLPGNGLVLTGGMTIASTTAGTGVQNTLASIASSGANATHSTSSNKVVTGVVPSTTTNTGSSALNTPESISEASLTPTVCTSNETTNLPIDANGVIENCDKNDCEAPNPQTSAAQSDSQDPNVTQFDSQNSNITSSSDEPKEVDLPEKKPALRKATILSGTKPKLQKSLLIDAKTFNAMNSELTSLVAKSSGGGGGDRIRKRKDNHKPAAVIEPPQKLLRTQQLEGSFLTALPGAENLKAATNVVKWDGMGLGMLPGSTLRFTRNAEGMLEIHEPLLEGKMEFSEENGDKTVLPRDSQEIYCCVVCSCYGLLSEFNSENFCSGGCLDSFLSTVERLSTKLSEEPLVISTVEEKKSLRRKHAEGDDNTDVPPAKQKKMDDTSGAIGGDVIQKHDNVKKLKPSEKVEDKKPGIIKLKSIDFINASQNATSGRQLRARETLSKKPMSKYVAGQDLEGEVSDDDEKIKNENVDPFPWSEYLIKTESKPAWIKLFSNPNPPNSNPFKIGFKLEAIDPERQSLFCAATIADVQGHRLKVHFDGYSNKYDFWTNIDSPNIFECGFCERHSFTLQPPCGMKKNSFNWAAYQAARKVRPCNLSWFRRNSCTSTNMFRPGMKLEAVDKKNTQLICVSTCVGVLENRILVHFDSWSDVYDYWVDTSSPYIHPVGWCKSRNRELTPPNYYNPATFSWEAYLKETKSDAAPLAAFTIRPPLEWKKNTKMEAVDKRAPHLLRVATITDVLPYQIKIVFDGFPDHFGYWVDDDSPDIHPINWGLKTGHQLSGPPEPYQILGSTCTTPGCVGDGNWKGLQSDKHSLAAECPYSNDHLHAESPLQDRMIDGKSVNNKEKKKPPALGHDSDSDSDDDPENNWKFLDVAVDRANAKDRVASDGTIVPVGKRNVPFILPAVQSFRGARPTVPKSAPTAQPVPEKTDDGGNAEKKLPAKRFERRESDSDSQERKFEKKAAEKNSKATRRSLPVKASGVGAVSKGRAADVANTDRLQPRKSSAPAYTYGLNRVKAKPPAELNSSKLSNILTWNREQCVNKLKDFPPKCQASLRKLKLNGERFLLLDQLFGTQVFENSASESISVSNTLTSLHKEALTGLFQWRARTPNSRFATH